MNYLYTTILAYLYTIILCLFMHYYFWAICAHLFWLIYIFLFCVYLCTSTFIIYSLLIWIIILHNYFNLFVHFYCECLCTSTSMIWRNFFYDCVISFCRQHPSRFGNGNCQNWRNNGGNKNNQADRENNPADVHSLISAVQSVVQNNRNNDDHQIHKYNGFMAKVKYRSNIAEISEDKTPDAYIDSGATHNFFFRKSSFITYTTIDETIVQGASGFTIMVRKGLVYLPIGNGIKV